MVAEANGPTLVSFLSQPTIIVIIHGTKVRSSISSPTLFLNLRVIITGHSTVPGRMAAELDLST
jgi:hypothetical protein